MESIFELDSSLQPTNSIINDACHIIEHAKAVAYKSANTILVQRNWLLGQRIALENMQGRQRADYGEQTIKQLASELTKIYGPGFTKTNLYLFLQFYREYPNIFHAVSGKSRLRHSCLSILRHRRFVIKMWGKWICTSKFMININVPMATTLQLVYCFVPILMKMWRDSRVLIVVTNSLPQSILPTFQLRKNCDVRLSNRN